MNLYLSMIIRFKCLHIKKMSGKRKNNIFKKKPSAKLALTARPATMQAQQVSTKAQMLT
jgi:hypothetical protein